MTTVRFHLAVGLLLFVGVGCGKVNEVELPVSPWHERYGQYIRLGYRMSDEQLAIQAWLGRTAAVARAIGDDTRRLKDTVATCPSGSAIHPSSLEAVRDGLRAGLLQEMEAGFPQPTAATERLAANTLLIDALRQLSDAEAAVRRAGETGAAEGCVAAGTALERAQQAAQRAQEARADVARLSSVPLADP